MAGLSDRQRRFVHALLDQRGKPNYALAARTAGYSDIKEAAKVRGFELVRHPAVIAALHEESRRRFTILGWRGVLGIAEIAADKKHRHHFKALLALVDRFGYAAVTEHKVTVERKDMTPAAVAERIRQVAALLGVDAGRLLGVNAAAVVSRETVPAVIEGEVVDRTEQP